MKTASMATLPVRDVPDGAYYALAIAARAEQRSRSQQAVVKMRRALAIGSADSRAAVVQRLRESGRWLPKRAATPEALRCEARDTR
jgi:hypothetical protein